MEKEREDKVRAYLASTQDTCSTKDIVDHFIPDVTEDQRRQAFFDQLGHAAKHELADCASRGLPQQGRGFNAGRMVRPWLWHAPDPSVALSESWKASVNRRLAAIEECIASLKASV